MRMLLHGTIAVGLALGMIGIVESGYFAHQPDGFARFQGTVMWGSAPAAAAHVRLTTSSGRHPGQTTTDRNGRFTFASVPEGELAVSVSPMGTLPSTSRFVNVTRGTRVDFVLPPTRVEIQFIDESGKPIAEGVQLTLRGPSSPTQYVTSGYILPEDRGKATFAGLEFGDFLMTAATQTDLTSTEPLRLSLSVSAPRMQATVKLARRRLELRLSGKGGPVSSPRIQAGFRILIPDSEGRIDATAVPPGEQIAVSAADWLPTCRLASLEAGQQVIELQRPGPFVAKLSLMNGPGRPVGFVDGLPNTDCPVGIGDLTTRAVQADELHRLRFEIVGLPMGVFGYRAQEMAPRVPLTLPSDSTLEYAVPERCRFCG